MLDVTGCELTPDDKELLDHPLVGGVILFSRNYYDQKQLAQLIAQIRLAARNQVLSAIPAMGAIYQQSAEDLTKAQHYCKTFGWLMAAECLAFDIDLSFAPVLDLNGVSDVIGDRSFHSQP